MSRFHPLRLALARALETGAWDGPVARTLSSAWGAVAARSLARPLTWGAETRVVTVGGATLGGSGKTPLAIACALRLAESGARVALVGHAYRASPLRARVVLPDDRIEEVGDEAIACARALAGTASVVVAPSRQEALSHAATRADVIVIDGVLQTAPRRASLALLALDAGSPWGAGEVVPRGDLRAPRSSLLAACDRGVLLEQATSSAGGRGSRGFWSATASSRGAFVSGRLVSWASLGRLRVGIFLALARPTRLLGSLALQGIVPSRVVRVPDHGIASSSLPRLLGDPSVDLWLASGKCALHLERAKVPHGVLDYELIPGAELIQALDDVAFRRNLHLLFPPAASRAP